MRQMQSFDLWKKCLVADYLAAAVTAHSEARTARRELDAAAARRAAAIRLALDSGHTHKEIADALEVSRPRIYQMLGK